MELRHLRYFVAVAEEGSLSVAAERRLHTSQPSLSRQMRDLENEIGVELLARSARGITLTPAGKAFLHHARLILAQTATATAAARHAAQSGHRSLALGFLTGYEPQWLPEVMRVLRDELPRIEVTISSRHSPQLAEELTTGKLDAAFMRAEDGFTSLAYRVLRGDPLIVVLPSHHRLAGREAIHPTDLVGETFVAMADQAPVLRKLVEDYVEKAGVRLTPTHRIEYLSMAMTVVASTGGVCILPEMARGFLTQSVISRPLGGKPPSIDLVLGYHTDNGSPVLALLLARIDDLVAGVSRRSE